MRPETCSPTTPRSPHLPVTKPRSELRVNHLETLPVDLFDSLGALTKLDLSYQYHLLTLPAGIFNSLKDLHELDLRFNGLVTLPDGIFDSLESLTEINLEYNDLETLPPGVFESLALLTSLDLEANHLETLPAGIFDSLTQLTYLDLEDNDNLETLPAGIFDSLTQLTRFYLTVDGDIDECDEGTSCFDLNDGMCTDEGDGELDLAECDITDADVESGALTACFEQFGESNILELDLQENALTMLPAGIFDTLVGLKKLYLDHNALTTLPAGVFDTLVSLERLYLHDNGLVTLPSGIFDALEALERLFLHDNEDLECLPAVPESVSPAHYTRTCDARTRDTRAFDTHTCDTHTCDTGAFDTRTCDARTRDTRAFDIHTCDTHTCDTGAFDTRTYEEVCMAGVPGILFKEVCCPSSCGSCAGNGCSDRDGGDDFTGKTHEEVCMAGVPGILFKEVCCPSSCGSCAGNGCSDRDGGDDFTGEDACCKSGILGLGRVCSATVGAPCVVEDEDAEEFSCSGDAGILKGDVCCEPPPSCPGPSPSYSIVLTSFIYPVVLHWGWAGGWASAWFDTFDENVTEDPLFDCGVIDFAGSGIVHMTGGIAALCAAIVVGPRHGRFNENGTANILPQRSAVLQSLGTLILWFGWFAFNAKLNDHYCDAGAANNGLLAGLVGVTAGCSTCEPEGAMVIGVVAGFVYTYASKLLVMLKIDDVVDAIPVHCFCGAWGVFAASLFAAKDNYSASYYSYHRADKCAGAFYGGDGSAVAANVVFMLAVDHDKKSKPRNLGMDDSKHGGQTYPEMVKAAAA
eukprot:g17879.t1